MKFGVASFLAISMAVPAATFPSNECYVRESDACPNDGGICTFCPSADCTITGANSGCTSGNCPEPIEYWYGNPTCTEMGFGEYFISIVARLETFASRGK